MKQALVVLCLVLGCVMATPVAHNIERRANKDDSNEPCEFFIAEIQVQVEEPRVESVTKREANENGTKRGNIISVSDIFLHINFMQYPSVVAHGSTIALQNYDRRYWLGCPGVNCFKANCPNLYMEGEDWTNCWGEVFEIYRASGPGEVLVGDVVGLHYPRERGRWFSMDGEIGHKDPCPGTPNNTNGFEDTEKWYQCCDEVFKIYTRGKSIGETIDESDDIMIYYLHSSAWVGHVEAAPDCRTCPGDDRPPPPEKYDTCWGEVFKLWLR